jgi:hypothetical protein
MALDIDEWPHTIAALAEHGIDLQQLYDAPDAVTIESGNPGHGKLLYAMPFGLALTTKRLTYHHEGQHKTMYELRCATANGLTTQDVLPPSIHPVTQRPYQWGGKGNWQRLPTIPQPLLDYWQRLLDKDQQRTISIKGAVDASWDEMRAALDSISPDVSREEWVHLGMALHSADPVVGLQVWQEWSSLGTKYKGDQDIQNCWRSFKDGDIKTGTLFHIALQYGWKRPLPDVTHLFSQVEPKKATHLIDSLTIQPPECDISLFPPILVKRALTLSPEMACDPLVSIFAGLGAACAAADARIRLHLMANWYVPPVLWLMTIGSPSAKKSPGSKPMLAPLIDLELEDRPRYAAELLKWEAQEAAYASSKKAYLAASGDPLNAVNGHVDYSVMPTVAAQTPRPTKLRMTVDDITSQKLARMSAERPRGLLGHLDEMASWAKKLGAANTSEDRSTWVKGYDCNRLTLDRQGDGKTDGDLSADHFALAIYGNMQPRVLRSNIEPLSADGLLQRFIFTILRDSFSDVKNDHTKADPIGQQEYDLTIRQIYALPATDYELSPDAFTAFRAFQDWYLTVKHDERLLNASPMYTEALGKIEGTTGRLILVFHLLTDPYSPYVAANTVANVVQLVKSYIVPAMRYAYGEIAGIDNGSMDHWVIQQIIHMSGDASTVTLSELRRSARRQVEKHTHQAVDIMLQESMELLEGAGWVSKVKQDNRSVQWAINPVVASQNESYKHEVRAARARIRDHIVSSIGNKYRPPMAE